MSDGYEETKKYNDKEREKAEIISQFNAANEKVNPDDGYPDMGLIDGLIERMNILEPVERDPDLERRQLERLRRRIEQQQLEKSREAIRLEVLEELSAIIQAEKSPKGAGFIQRLLAVPFIKGFSRVAIFISVMVTIGAGLLLSVKASRNIIFNALFHVQDDHVAFEFSEEDDSLANTKSILDHLPAGFEFDRAYTTEGRVLETYVNQDGEQILFQRSNAEYAALSVDNEIGEFKEVTLEGVVYYLYEGKDEHEKNSLMVVSGDYVFSLSSDISMSEIVKIAQSMINAGK